MSRVLGIDYGKKKVGLAISDPLRLIATPFAIVPNDKGLAGKLKQFIKEEKITHLVLGKPVSLSGEKNQQLAEVERFQERLERELGMPVFLYDERYSSKMAKEVLREDKGRKDDDDIAAAVILQEYLELI